MSRIWKRERLDPPKGNWNYSNWDYNVLPLEQHLNKLEREGWTIHSVCPPTHQYCAFFILCYKDSVDTFAENVQNADSTPQKETSPRS